MIETRGREALLALTGRQRALLLGGFLALTSGLVGLSLALTGPIITLGLLVALVLAVWALTNLEVALWGVIAVVALFPFGTLPFKLVLTPSFLDLALGGVLAVYLMQWMTGQRRRLLTTPLHALILAFALLAAFNFVLGLRNAGLTPNLLRRFAEFLLSVGLALTLTDMLRTPRQFKRLALALMLAGSAAAALAIAFYALPDGLAQRLLNGLSVFGYPQGGVLRYIEDNPELAERAIGTGVDPNALGGFLVILAALIAPQLGTRHPVVRRRWQAAGMLALIVVTLVLTYSRGAMIAFGVALAYIAAVKYRRLLLVVALVGGLLLLLPFTQDYVQHFIEGTQGTDLATQMRFGEYGDALKLITRYPVTGVGFGGSPDIDLYLGVSSIYLLIAETMGLVGLAAFLLLMLSIMVYATTALPAARAQEGLEPLLLGLTAGLLGVMASGVFDHYFFNIQFPHTVTALWLVIGLTLAATRLARSPEGGETERSDAD